MCIEKLAITIRNEKDVPLVSKVGLNICYRHNFCRWLQPRFDCDLTAIRLRLDYVSTTIRSRYDHSTTYVSLPVCAGCCATA